MAHVQLYHHHHGAYLPVRIPFERNLYYDPFGFRVYIDGQAFHPTDVPESVVHGLSWGDQLEIQFYTLETHLKVERREEEEEHRRLEALEIHREYHLSFYLYV
ncbi:hypothetical protein DCAR_0934518 [Daucus carota subsp. sativus]|uniref:Uncharacterized protein n=1 Tax=Daucus carota subsp. sativus TaxID=79200 RepID=A0A175YF13_DAUCS|nr:hypothetical protein DCAR_0934518 [Daucus carota subsp. sativus]